MISTKYAMKLFELFMCTCNVHVLVLHHLCELSTLSSDCLFHLYFNLFSFPDYLGVTLVNT